jgi:Calcineurin-like phosphoesterase
MPRKPLVTLFGLVFGLALARAGRPQTPASAPSPVPTPRPPDPVLVGAGDIASCGSGGDEQTAALLDKIEGTVFTLGDNVYPNGTANQFLECYDPTWGRQKARTRPVPGNHDYRVSGAAGYFGYFGGAAGDPRTGYYAYDMGPNWRVLVLNSNCGQIGGCGPGSAQEKWLKKDLADNPRPCTVAMWHHPLYSSGEHGDDTDMRNLWRVLYDAGADLVLSGHDHTYERFAPQDADGRLDAKRGLRSFVVGTGGRSHYDFHRPERDSELRNNTTYGVLKLTLHPDSYDWEFIPVAGETFRDSGTGKCH